MSNCNKYVDILSLYVDGELSNSKVREVDSHLAKCEQCSALLDVYREISIAEKDSIVPAPEGLLSNVMNELPDYKRSQKPIGKIIMTRIMPIAACFIVAFLAWRVFSFTNMTDNAAPEYNYGGFTAYDNAGASGGGTAKESTEESADYDADGAYQETDSPDTTNFSTDDADSNLRGGQEGDVFFESATNAQGQEQTEFDNIINNASLWITIIGELPKYLEKLEPKKIDLQEVFDYLYIIPSEDVSVITDELENLTKRSATTTTYDINRNTFSSDSDYAVVLYKKD